MSWFKRSEKGIQTRTEEKKDIPKGLWYKTPTGKIVETQELAENFYVSPEDEYHVRIGSKEYFEILFDDNHFKELALKLVPKDFLNFTDSKKYSDRLKDVTKKTGLKDAIRTAVGKSKGKELVIALHGLWLYWRIHGFCGRRENCACNRLCYRQQLTPCDYFKIWGSKNDGRSIFVMQMAKTSAKLNKLAESNLPYISLCTDPTTGGTTASFAMLGDINIAEPGALIAFAGPV